MGQSAEIDGLRVDFYLSLFGLAGPSVVWIGVGWSVYLFLSGRMVRGVWEKISSGLAERTVAADSGAVLAGDPGGADRQPDRGV